MSGGKTTTQATTRANPQAAPPTRIRRILDSDFVYDFRRAPLASIAAIVVALLFLVAILAPLGAPTSQGTRPPAAGGA